MYAGGAFGYYYFFNLFANGILLDSLEPANVSDRESNPRAEYVMASFNIKAGNGQCSSNTCNGIAVFAISNPLVVSGSPGPELSAVVVPTAHNYGLPPGARQRGGAALVDTGDTRIGGTTAYSAGNVYGSLNTRNNVGQTSVLWFEIHPTLNDNDARCTGAFLNDCPQVTAATMVNEDCFFCNGYGVNGSSYYGTLQPDSEGNVTMVYAFSDDNNYPSLAYVSRRTSQLANTMHDSGIFAASGAGSYTQGRWGDYTGVSLDESSANVTKWFSGMYSLSNGNWSTAIDYNGFLTPNQP